MQPTPTVDVLAVGAHPDDVEFHAGGTLLHLASLGYSTGILDLTRGESASRGTPEIRAAEAEAAARVLGLSHRSCVDLGDGQLADTLATRTAVALAFRRLQPRLVLTHHWDQPHPDHVATARIVTAAAYLAGLAHWQTASPLPRHRPSQVAHFGLPHSVQPSFIVDVSAWASKKDKAIRCHRSQLHDPASTAPASAVSSPDHLDRLDAIHRYYGTLIRTRYGEAFVVRGVLSVEDPVRLLSGPMGILP
jgi:bacillithiol biosynthesis deacetylase BshB1